jgi:hypothetical protein
MCQLEQRSLGRAVSQRPAAKFGQALRVDEGKTMIANDAVERCN